MVRAIIIVGFIVVIGILATWFFIGRDEVQENLPPEGAITIAGEMVCLPHRDTDGPQTMECAYGLKGDDGNYYALREVPAPVGPSAITTVPTGARVDVVGQFSVEEDQKYATVGVITIETLTEQNGSANIETHSDGRVTFSVPTDFGLAVTEDQILVEASVPPCTSDFSYCLYYLGTAYDNTNFESAGLSIETEPTLATEEECLATPPAGFSEVTPTATSTGNGYSMSVFTDLGNAATGQAQVSDDYRLFVDDMCYQMIASVGTTAIEMAATSSTADLQEFTETERASLLGTMRGVIENMTLDATGEQLSVPSV